MYHLLVAVRERFNAVEKDSMLESWLDCPELRCARY